MVMLEEKPSHPLDAYMRTDRLPHIWCPGCGIGIALQQFLWAVKELHEEGKLDPNKIVFATGIGCTGRASGFVKFDTAHTPHGRAIPFAVGVKLANPSLIPVVFSGDGDIASIGGNHMMHAARRNFDMLVIMVNNMTYGLTGGQLAPTTPHSVYSTTTPMGNPESPIDATKVVYSISPNFVARMSITHPNLIRDTVKKALLMKGFRWIEVLSTCPEIFGRHINMRDPYELYSRLKKVVKFKKVASANDIKYDWNSEITCGVFTEKNDPSYMENYLSMYGLKEKLGVLSP
ncbi:MAG: thiamine pyrophosphate-dependent enzyme [Conexivisphaerales archaeon]|jgi:2-oxoglutarate ferredoxin oxidoreductase subunit beta|nr:thiamine pyrophosphate-dependent enzyme [Conexivisphaerales archaeon]